MLGSGRIEMLTLQEVQQAAQALQGKIENTPCLHSRTLSQMAGCETYLKFENLQFTGSFKERGARFKLESLTPSERGRGVIACSAGNHAQGVAYHAQQLGIPATIVMPEFASAVKVARTRAFAAQVVLQGKNFDEAKTEAYRLAQQKDFVFVHPYDDEKIIAGQGTIALEMLQACPQLDVLVVPIGGGGLMAGIALAARNLKPELQIIGVQTQRFPSMWAALRLQTPEFGVSTIADGIAVKQPGRITQDLIRQYVDDIVLVDEADIEQAIVALLEIEKTVVEGAGAAGLAAVMRYRERFAGKRVGLVLCGGNIDPLVLAGIIERGMARSGRLARICVEVRDTPGGLAEVAQQLARSGANIDQIHHHRVFSTLPVQSVEIEFVVRARGLEHVAEMVQALIQLGYHARHVP